MALDPQFAESIRDVRASFGFSHFDCDPGIITEALHIVPDEVRRRGDELTPKPGRRFTVPFNSWCISSSVASKDVNDHIRELLTRLSRATGRLDPRWGAPSFNVLYKATHLFGGNGPFYETDVVQGIAGLGAELWQDIYSLEDVIRCGDDETPS